ncbi:MAG: hypothetical protein SGPRY_013536, partial [Prymnesium sp.]
NGRRKKAARKSERRQEEEEEAWRRREEKGARNKATGEEEKKKDARGLGGEGGGEGPMLGGKRGGIGKSRQEGSAKNAAGPWGGWRVVHRMSRCPHCASSQEPSTARERW